MISETETEISEKLSQAGKTFNEFKDYLKKHFADMDIEFKDWYIGFSKTEGGHTIEIKAKLNIKKKAPQ
jgi:hemerythrin